MIVQALNVLKKTPKNPYGKDFHVNPHGCGQVSRTIRSKSFIANEVYLVFVDSLCTSTTYTLKGFLYWDLRNLFLMNRYKGCSISL